VQGHEILDHFSQMTARSLQGTCACAIVSPLKSAAATTDGGADTNADGGTYPQSPINLRGSKDMPKAFSTAKMWYGTSEAHCHEKEGHTIQCDLTAGGPLVFRTAGDGFMYALLQFHFHSPSETTVDGKQYDLEMHLVHKRILPVHSRPTGYCDCAEGRTDVKYVWAPVPDDKIPGWETLTYGHLAVVALPFEIGAHNVFLDQFLGYKTLPEKILSFKFDALDLDEMWETTFEGSLTTPPYTGKLSWNVVNHVFQLSPKQMEQYLTLAPEPYAREVQPSKGRVLTNYEIEQF